MKTIYKYILCAFIMLSTAACDYLDLMPDDIVTVNSMFEDRYTAERYLATCYKGLPNSASDNSNPAVLGSMEVIFNHEDGWFDSRGMQIARGKNSATSNYIDHWQNGLYGKIRVCNDFLAGIDQVDDLTTQEKDRMKAEVKLLKAYMHFYLLRYYGPICILQENVPVNESTQAYYSERKTIDECFSYILGLIQEVIDSEDLPLIIQNRSSDLGRFSSPVAYTLKAKVSLFWASPLFNGNKEYNSFSSKSGQPFFNQTYDDTRWQKAAEACDEAIKVCQDAGIRLYQMSDYSNANLSYEMRQVNMLRSAFSERWNCELIWGNTVNPIGSDFQGKSCPVLVAAEGYIVSQTYSVPFPIVEKFYTKNGLPSEHDKDFDQANRYSMIKYENSNSFPYDFEYNKRYIAMNEITAGMNYDREPRYYSTFGFDRGVWYGNSYTDPTGDTGDNLPTFVFPKNHYGESASVYNATQYNTTGYWPKKIVHLSSSFTSTRDFRSYSYPYPELRFADLLLMAAEAWNEVEGPTSKVIKYIDQIRNRAGLDGLEESYRNYAITSYKSYPTSSKDNMRKIIQRERMIELACESNYHWDVRRWKLAKEELNRPVQGWQVKGANTTPEEYYIPTVLYMQSFTVRDYFAPVPEQDIIKNPLLVQNPGW